MVWPERVVEEALVDLIRVEVEQQEREQTRDASNHELHFSHLDRQELKCRLVLGNAGAQNCPAALINNMSSYLIIP